MYKRQVAIVSSRNPHSYSGQAAGYTYKSRSYTVRPTASTRHRSKLNTKYSRAYRSTQRLVAITGNAAFWLNVFVSARTSGFIVALAISFLPTSVVRRHITPRPISDFHAVQFTSTHNTTTGLFLFQCTKPVSYTHLDVYKRQLHKSVVTNYF